MAKLHRAAGIQLSDDYSFTRKSWKVERAGWGLLFGIVGLALLGVLAPGLVSHRSAAAGYLAVEYERVGHLKTDGTVTVLLTPRPDDSDHVSFWIDRKYLDEVTLDEIQPHPIEVRPGDDRTTFVFPAPPRHSQVAVRLAVVPDRPGRLAGRFGRGGDAGVDVRQFIYP